MPGVTSSQSDQKYVEIAFRVSPDESERVALTLDVDCAGPRPLLVVGGPRFDPTMAADLGVDKIFGRGTTPREVASYLVHALAPPGESPRADGAPGQGGPGGWSPPGKKASAA